MFLTLFIVSRFFSLGDMESYLNGYYYDPKNMFFSSTYFVGHILNIWD